MPARGDHGFETTREFAKITAPFRMLKSPCAVPALKLLPSSEEGATEAQFHPQRAVLHRTRSAGTRQ
ncbi:hypothetical protein [Desulfotruncus arcticus]|uniref:hypothetical protein n=1 Tax=Desulfotruncus arcticus TaxID=341036 RepID=UPI0013F4D727|nr:hypothetical protein [Desulfotruncus arcticus]